MRKFSIDRLHGEKCSVDLCKVNINTPEEPHTHEFVEMVYILDGEGIHTINNCEYRVKRGDMLFINYKQVHSFVTEHEMTIVNILLNPEFISEELITVENAFSLLSLSAFSDFREKCDRETSLVNFEGEDRDLIEALIRVLNKECRSSNIGSDTLLRSGFTLILTYVFRKLSKEKSDNGYSEFQMLQYIKEHLSEQISLEELAKQSFYNPSYFSRMFKEKCGITLTSYIRKNRLERACSLLKDNALSIDEVARLSGFGNASVFHKKFKSAYGMTPTKWRNAQK